MKQVTMNNLLQNPSGPYSAYFARRDIVIKNLQSRYSKLMQKHKDFQHVIYRDKDDFIFYFKIPSEKYEKLFYDVVIKFIPNSEGSVGDMTLNNYSVNLFSNSPNFTFTYAYLYNKDGIIVPELKEKVSSKALTQEAVVKNPLNAYGFEKSVYFALLYIKGFRLNIKSALISKAEKPDYNKVFKGIKTSEAKLKEYNRLKQNEQLQKENSKARVKKVAKNSKTGDNKKVVSSGGAKSKRLSEQASKSITSKKSMNHTMKHDMSIKSGKKLSSRSRKK